MTEKPEASRVTSMQAHEARLGMLRSLVDLCLESAHQPILEKPIVSMKELCSDFVVRELAPGTGEALFLEGPLPTPGDVGGVSAGHKRSRDDVTTSPTAPADAAAGTPLDEARASAIRQAFADLVNEEELASLLAMVPQDLPRVVIASVADKQKRTRIHAAVKACFASTHISTTEDGSVVVSKATAADRRESRRRSNPIRSRPFLHFTLYKENMDSAHAFRALASSLHVSTRQFQYCGTKDKRAVTLQRVAIRDMAPARLAVVNEHTYPGTMKVCQLAEEPTGLRLGDARGNRFEIVLRCAPTALAPARSESNSGSGAPVAVVTETWRETIVHCLSTVGAVNYYGPQRFGTTKVLTSDVGLHLLRGDFEAALYLCLESRSCLTAEVADALAPLKARDYEAALAKLPHFCHQERDMVNHLIAHANDFVGAFLALPRTLAMLYFHAVQSLVWNTMASARLANASRLRPEVGDLVLEEVYKTRLATRDRSVVVDVANSLRDDDQALSAVRRLSADDPLDVFALSDVLLPVPGPDRALVFPTSQGCTKEDYQATLAGLGVQEALLPADVNAVADAGRTNALIRVFHFHGTYRPLCVVPSELSLTHRTVDHWRAPANTTDLEKLADPVPAEATTVTTNGALTNSVGSPSPCECLITQFSLPPGSYATSVLREFAVLCSQRDYTEASVADDTLDGTPDVAVAAEDAAAPTEGSE